MSEKKLYPFVLNDENVINSYGFRVRNSGINFQRFDDNPVMLEDHRNETAYVRGNWKNRRTEGSKLVMDGNFDVDLPAAQTLEGQVDRGFVKGASPGLAIDWSEDPFERQPDGNWDLIRSEMVEGTVCAVPSGPGSLVQLLDKRTGEIITEDQIKLSLAQLKADFKNSNTPTMEGKITLTTDAAAFLLAFGLTNCDTAPGISNAIMKLKAELDSKDQKYNDLKTEHDKQIKLQAEALVDAAIAAEKIVAGDKAEWVELALANLSLATKQINKLPGKVSLTAGMSNSSGTAATATAVKSIDDFEKLSNEAKLAWKEANPEEYKSLFKR
ncbi:hypothetical protein ACFS5N_16295 [Mucilaginibacter ximonensis]|uniref:Prohead serine protease n=1 Tax=Mucilaginibacter ximonensis TaxID=538021 RepID=A0ABW5YFM8_9SPHI